MGGTKTVHARITGRVQGVWFRAWTRDEAQARGLSGWVRNEEDGTVTALLSGPAREVDAMVEALHRGPSRARVEGVSLTPAEVPGSDGFDILR